MTVSYFVRYAGAPATGPGFVERYRGVHVPILLAWPRLRSVVLRTPAAAEDPFAVRAGATQLLVELAFDSAADLAAALRSPARARAREDFARMPPFAGEITHEALIAEVHRP